VNVTCPLQETVPLSSLCGGWKPIGVRHGRFDQIAPEHILYSDPHVDVIPEERKLVHAALASPLVPEYFLAFHATDHDYWGLLYQLVVGEMLKQNARSTRAAAAEGERK